MSDMVNHPKHYTAHPSGVECWDIAEPFGYFLGNAVKYIWRQGLKDDGQKGIQDLRKAIVYIEQEIKRREKASEKPPNAGIVFPRRSDNAEDCTKCRGKGWIAVDHGQTLCPFCGGCGFFNDPQPTASQLHPK